MNNIDILLITETKLDSSFPSQQFAIEGYSQTLRLDRTSEGGGLIIYVRECRQIKNLPMSRNFKGIFLEINLRKTKWLLFGGYNPIKSNINKFLKILSAALDQLMIKYDNFLLLGDFNSEIQEPSMRNFANHIIFRI